MFALRAYLEMAVIFHGAEKNWVLLARFFLSKRKKNLAGTLSGKVLANPTEVDTIWGKQLNIAGVKAAYLILMTSLLRIVIPLFR